MQSRTESVKAPVGIRWVEEDLWWERFVEKVCLESGMEERGSDGWCNGGDR